MRKLGIFIFVFIISITSFAQETIKIGGWRIHLPYNSVEQLVETPNLIYVMAEIGIYSFNKVSGEIELYSKVNGLSETAVACMEYSEEHNALVIGYDNTNVDILKDGKIINLPGILRKTIVGKKEINEIRIFGDKAYLATSFGVVVVDLANDDIFDSYLNIGAGGSNLELYSAAEYQGNLYLGTELGIYRAPLTGKNLSDFNSWSVFKPNGGGANLMRVYDNKLFFVEDSILRYYDGNTYQDLEAGAQHEYQSITLDHGKMTVCKTEGITVYENTNVYREVNERFKFAAIFDHEDNVWTGGFYSGLIKISPANQYSFLRPQGPFGPTSYAMESIGNQIWVTSGGRATNYSPTFNNFGYYVFEDGKWTNRDPNEPVVGTMFDFTAIATNPTTNEVWMGTFGTGIARIKDGKFVERFDHTNSILQQYVNDWTISMGMAFDQNQDLWMTNFESSNALAVRRNDGTWESFNLRYKGTEYRRVGRIIVDENNTKWMLVERSSSAGGTRGMLVFNHNEDGQPIIRALSEGEGNGGLPNNTVNVAILDKDGEVWVGTESGLAIFYNPSLVFQRGDVNADAQQIIIDDGEDVGYLLGNEVINDIKIDGANRKWVATNNGVWLIKADGSAVVQHFTTSNSPLPSDQVNCLAINPISGEVFFGTTAGIISYRSDATEASNLHENTLVYPNPVHEGYDGPITITGLPANATVKIADVAGRVVYELIATGGTAVWDGRNFAGERPQTGVYLIFSANEDDEDALVSKLLIVR
ncbi:hypothetical protein GYB22_05015 [bacterium]|nr:hypothetical protein [bacterium]